MSTRNKLNTWFAKQNHTRLAKKDITKLTVTTSLLALFALGGINPSVGFSIPDDVYAVDGADVDGFTDVVTLTSTSNGTLIDSDGYLKWRAHNLPLTTASAVTQSVTVVSGQKYTVNCTGSGSVTLSNAGTGTATSGSPVTITAASTTLTLTVAGSVTAMWYTRGELDVQTNPATGSTFISMSTSAQYLTRFDYSDGEKAALKEPQRTNSLSYSNTLTSWTINGTDSLTLTAADAVGPDNKASLTKLAITDTTSEFHGIQQSSLTIVSGQKFVASAVVDYTTGQQQHVGIRVYAASDQWVSAIFDISSGTVTLTGEGSVSGTISGTGVIAMANGTHRIWISGSIANTFATMSLFTSDSATPTFNAFGGALGYAGTAGVYFHAGFMDFNANGSVPVAHIPTNGSSVTRAADTLTIAAAKLPQDYPDPEYVGENLTPNATFDSNITGWTDASDAGGAIAWNASGYLDTIRTTGTARARCVCATEVGKTYELLVTCVFEGGTALVNIGTSAGGVQIAQFNTGTGVHEKAYFVATTTTTHIQLAETVNGRTTSWDNVYLREVVPPAISFVMKGTMTYADNNAATEMAMLDWRVDGNNLIQHRLNTIAGTGRVVVNQFAAGVSDTSNSGNNDVAPGTDVDFAIAARHGSNFIQGALGGSAFTADVTPTSLADLTSAGLVLAYDGSGPQRIKQCWVYNGDIGQAGIEAGSLAA